MLDERQECKALSCLALDRILCFPLQPPDEGKVVDMLHFPSQHDETLRRAVDARKKSQEQKPRTLHSAGFPWKGQGRGKARKAVRQKKAKSESTAENMDSVAITSTCKRSAFATGQSAIDGPHSTEQLLQCICADDQ